KEREEQGRYSHLVAEVHAPVQEKAGGGGHSFDSRDGVQPRSTLSPKDTHRQRSSHHYSSSGTLRDSDTHTARFVCLHNGILSAAELRSEHVGPEGRQRHAVEGLR